MLYDILRNEDRTLYTQFTADLSTGIPPMTFTPDDIDQAVVYRIDQVAENYFTQSRDYIPEEFHNIAPPYDRTWFEFPQPKKGNDEGVWVDYEKGLKDIMGPRFDVTQIVKGIYVRAWDRFNPADEAVFQLNRVTQNARWLFRAMIFFTLGDGRIVNSFNGMSWQVNDQGKAIPFDNDPEHPYVFDINKNDLAISSQRRVCSYISGTMMPVFMTLALLQCKNVRVDTISPIKGHPKVGSRKARRKAGRMKRRDESWRAHHVIVVDPAGTNSSTRSQEKSKHKGVTAWHQVPGTFRTYTGVVNPETGRKSLLFGRPDGIGTFFVPAHERGTPALGQITKEYEVK